MINKNIVPQVSEKEIEKAIIAEFYHRGSESIDTPNCRLVAGANMAAVGVALHCLTICILLLDNGYVVTGSTSCDIPESEPNAELFRRFLARRNAIDQCFSLFRFRAGTCGALLVSE